MANLATINEAADELSVKPVTVRKWVAERRLPHVRMGRAIRIPREVLRRFVEENTIPARPLR